MLGGVLVRFVLLGFLEVGMWMWSGVVGWWVVIDGGVFGVCFWILNMGFIKFFFLVYSFL